MGYLSDIARRRIAAVILIVAAIVAVLALTDKAVFDDPPTGEEQVAMAVEGFFAAAAEGDFEGYCARLTERARRTIESQAQAVSGSDEDLTCAQIAATAADRFAGLETKIRLVSVSGSRARVQIALKPADGPSEIRTVLLESPDPGVWLISDSG